ncbi:MAG: alpha,alpha-trehalose-phosphate synthase (UDP-forming) [Aeromicrobium sp.]
MSPSTPVRRRAASRKASFVVIANRLPVDRDIGPDGTVQWRKSPGGLVTALEPVMRRNGGAWIGWHGAADEKIAPFHHDGIDLVPVHLTAAEIKNYYEGFSNATLWPLYHDVVAHPEFHREWWDAYVAVNKRFAERAAKAAGRDAVVWVQDYQLQLVPKMLRELRPDLRIGFFLHIPFPPTELFGQLPWRRQILEGLLGADLVGFQLPGAAQNFVRLVRQRVGYKTHRDTVYLPDGRSVLAKAYPISIDAAAFEALARRPETTARAEEIRRSLGNPQHVLLGIDRLDYTKGLRQRLRAFGELIAEGKIDVDDAVFIQVATPSRERVDQYRILRDDIDRLVGRINGDVGRIGQQPITYLHASYPRSEMAALYRAADVMVVTPLRDGMNLVAKEYVACRYDNLGALVLSEFAGASAELKQAYQVNPYDINGTKAALLQAMSASDQENSRRMKAMRKQVNENDIDHWASNFLDELITDRDPHEMRLRPVKTPLARDF